MNPADLLKFVAELGPELVALFQHTKGDAKQARSRLHTVLDKIDTGRQDVDAILKARREEEAAEAATKK